MLHRSSRLRRPIPTPWGWVGLAIAATVLWSGFLGPAFAQAQPQFQTATGERWALPAVVESLRDRAVVYLGEIHDRPEDHALQLTLIQALHRQRPDLAIGLEMFQQPAQQWLDQYLAGTIDLATLRQVSEYDRRWGYPWEFYAPILAYARQAGIPLVALNAPTEAVRIVARQGLSALPANGVPHLPVLGDLELDYQPHRNLLATLYAEMHQGHGAGAGFEFFFQAQVLWDEAMAAAIAHFHRQSPHRQWVILVGQGHIIYGYGIPRRVQRHFPGLSQATLLLSSGADWPPGTAPRADFEGLDPLGE